MAKLLVITKLPVTLDPQLVKAVAKRIFPNKKRISTALDD